MKCVIDKKLFKKEYPNYVKNKILKEVTVNKNGRNNRL